MCEICAQKVLDILDEMERNGEFDGLTADEKEIERQSLGMRLRADMECPEERPKKVYDVTLVRYRGVEVTAESEEKARIMAEEEKDSDEIVGVIEEVKE